MIFPASSSHADHRWLQEPTQHLLPQDAGGHTRLAAKEIEMQFTDHWDMGLMDYNGSLQEANDLVTIHLWDLRSFRQHIDDVLAWPLLSYEKTRWKSRREWFDYMGSCRNDEFTFGGVSIRLPETMLLYVSLRPTVAPQAA